MIHCRPNVISDVLNNPGIGFMTALIPPDALEQARANVLQHSWATAIRDRIVMAAAPWRAMPDDDLWALMFGPSLTRSWMVWSNGHCPSCAESVPMYNWRIEALAHPWKLFCPHCRASFPKNDFAAFYRSGLDGHGLFDVAKADRSLLFNAEHPDPQDPLHAFGVDDGNGYVEGEKRWRFIGAYLIYGQWKQVVLGGIRALSDAYWVTGDAVCAHKAAILLDRVADVYASFDFLTQAIEYDVASFDNGYVSVWHDACEETRELALAYDQIRPALDADRALAAFLDGKARRYGLSVSKATGDDIRRNIESGILRDAIAHPHKIKSNYPRTEIALALMHRILGGAENLEEADALIAALIEKATAVDGVTGEKGLANYSPFTIQALAVFLARMERTQPGFLAGALEQHPSLRQTFRFFIDTRCLDRYYPLVGDSGWFAAVFETYVGVPFSRHPGVDPSMFTFLWQLYEQTGDAAYVQMLYAANGGRVDGLPYDLFEPDPAAFQTKVADVIARHGPTPELGSMDKKAWHLAILRSGTGARRRAAWLAYDTGGRHGHANGMNLGLFAHGLDLMPDFGYPPVQYGGELSPRARWYRMTAAHNTVVVDGTDQPYAWSDPKVGRTTLWADGLTFRAIRASDPAIAFSGELQGKQYERMVALVDRIADAEAGVPGRAGGDFYLVDIFRVAGGSDHAKFMHSHFGQIATTGLALQPAPDFGHDTLMRNFRSDAAAQPGWSVDWTIAPFGDPANAPPGTERDLHLRYTDLTPDAEASVCEGWIATGGYDSTTQAWIPRVMTRRREQPSSTFVAVIEPYVKQSSITGIRRMPLTTEGGVPYGEAHVALEIAWADGRRDLFISVDVENPLAARLAWRPGSVLIQPEWQMRLDGEMALIRRDAEGKTESLALGQGQTLSAGDCRLTLKDRSGFVEIRIGPDGPQVVAGHPRNVAALVAGG